MTSKVAKTFIEQMGLSVQEDGLPRIAGRMFGFFVMHGGTHSFSELAEKLQVSRGSVSTNARLLESLGILERTARPGDRQDYYRLSDDPYGQLLRGYVVRMERNLERVIKARKELPGKAAAQVRLSEMERFYRTALATTMASIESWNEASSSAA